MLPPRSPKLAGHVERAQRTHTEEFWEAHEGNLEVRALNRALQEWERVYNFVRPHQAYQGKTPARDLLEYHPEVAPQTVSHVVNEYMPLTDCRKTLKI